MAVSVPITPDMIVGAAIDELVRLRPAALLHINAKKGRYWALIQAWRAQATVLCARHYDELRCSRLYGATGRPLRELVASEFLTELDESPTTAFGIVRLVRPAFVPPNTPGTEPMGVIPAGYRFVRQGDPTAVPIPTKTIEAVTSEPILVSTGQLTVDVPINATASGDVANMPQETGVTTTANVVPQTALFDSTFSATYMECAGGRSGIDDGDIRRIAAAQPFGNIGPTEGALIASILKEAGVRYAVSIPDRTLAYSVLFPADSAWGWSQRWANGLKQDLLDTTSGFGCRINIGKVTNIFVRVAATIQLRSARLLFDTSDISEKVRAAIKSYFDDRDDWYLWTTNGLQAAISACDPRIFACTLVTITDRSGNVLTPPSPPAEGTSAPTVSHYYFLADSLVATYQAPA